MKKQSKSDFGLSTNALKLIALVFMTVDHVGYLCGHIPFVADHSILLRTLGRIAAPLVLFAVVQGCRHTRSKPRYALRLYAAGVLAGLFHAAMNRFFGGVLGVHSFGVIFFTFAYAVLFILVIEQFTSCVDRSRPLLAVLWLALGAAAYCLRYASAGLFPFLCRMGLSEQLAYDLSLALCPQKPEYGWTFVTLAVVLYFLRGKGRQIAGFAAFCVLCLGVHYALPTLAASAPQFVSSYFVRAFCNDIQIWMFLAIPFMALYNGRPGHGSKLFFYVYYPVHMYVLLAIDLIFAK